MELTLCFLRSIQAANTHTGCGVQFELTASVVAKVRYGIGELAYHKSIDPPTSRIGARQGVTRCVIHVPTRSHQLHVK